MHWKLAGAGLLALGTVLGASGAQAAQGCGPGFHRGVYGFCRPNAYRPYGFYRPYGYRPAFYGPRPWRGPGWGWRRHWHHAGWGGPRWHGGWRHRW